MATLPGASTYSVPASPHHPPKLTNIETRYNEVGAKWDASEEKQDLVRQIKNIILTQNTIFLDNALCIGLGSFHRKRSDGKVDSTERSLYQFVVFETTLELLRENSNIGPVRFQDPAFTPSDIEFLEGRGYIVLPCKNSDVSYPLHSRLEKVISSSTFCFAPYVDSDVLAPVICAAKRSLFLGYDLLWLIHNHLAWQYIELKGPFDPTLQNIFRQCALTRDCSPVSAFVKHQRTKFKFGFMWEADMQDLEKVIEMAERQRGGFARSDRPRLGVESLEWEIRRINDWLARVRRNQMRIRQVHTDFLVEHGSDGEVLASGYGNAYVPSLRYHT